MEPARSTDKFTRRITVADSNNIVTVLDLNIINSEYQIFAEDYICKFQVALEDLKVTVGLFSLAAAPFPDTNALMSDAKQQAAIAQVQTEGQKIALGLYTAKGNGPWEYQSRVVLQNQAGDENHVPIMVPFLSTNETLLVGGDFKLGAKIEPIWNQPLKAQDYLVVHGTYKQVVSFSKKKDDSLKALGDRISAIESLLSIYGAPTAHLPGTNGLVPAPPANGGNRILRGDRTWQDPATLPYVPVSNNGVFGSVNISGTVKGGWGGVRFEGTNDKYLLFDPTTANIGFYNQSIPRWDILVSSAVTTVGTPLSINNSATIAKVITLRTIISLPSIAAGGLHTVDLSLTGALVGQYVHVVPVINSVMNGFWTFYVHAQILSTNTLSIFFKNDWTGNLDLPDFWIRVLYVEFN